MILFDLFYKFFLIGLFSFGGGYAAVPLIRDTVTSSNWMSEAELTNMIAISESTPGPLMINLATYIGSEKAGFWGAVLATFAVTIPSMLIMILIMLILKNTINNKYVVATMDGLQASVSALVLATAVILSFNSLFFMSELGSLEICAGITNIVKVIDIRALIILLFLLAISWLYKKFSEKSLSTISLIVISALLGSIIYGIM